jgi:hypothetical protein
MGELLLVGMIEEESHLVLHEFRPTATLSHFGRARKMPPE